MSVNSELSPIVERLSVTQYRLPSNTYSVSGSITSNTSMLFVVLKLLRLRCIRLFFNELIRCVTPCGPIL